MSAEVADVLERAADYIDEHGWCQERYTTDGVKCCAAGAINMVTTGDPGITRVNEYHIARYVALETLGDVIEENDGWGSVSEWNDHPGRTQAEVVAKLREVAAAERAKAAKP